MREKISAHYRAVPFEGRIYYGLIGDVVVAVGREDSITGKPRGVRFQVRGLPLAKRTEVIREMAKAAERRWEDTLAYHKEEAEIGIL